MIIGYPRDDEKNKKILDREVVLKRRAGKNSCGNAKKDASAGDSKNQQNWFLGFVNTYQNPPHRVDSNVYPIKLKYLYPYSHVFQIWMLKSMYLNLFLIIFFYPIPYHICKNHDVNCILMYFFIYYCWITFYIFQFIILL